MIRVLDLFSGIGGFSYGLEMTGGFQTVAFCEKEPFRQKVLKKHWPKVPIFDDAREVNYDGEIDLICGGFPCQPFSVAGQRRGKDDDRHLWPEMLALIKKHRPRWVIGENVANFVNMALDDVLFDLEGEDYETQAFIIPACAVNAPHRRDRCWILAYSGCERQRPLEKVCARRDAVFGGGADSGNVADTGSLRLQESRQCERPLYSKKSQGGKADNAVDGCGRIAEPGLGGGFDEISTWLDRSFGDDWEAGIPRTTTRRELRNKRLAALGDSVVPPLLSIIGQAILEVEQ